MHRSSAEPSSSSFPVFDVVTVVRNDLDGIARTRAAVMGQTYPAINWIVVDGGSTDGTREYLEYYRRYLYWWRSQPDGGIYDAMNQGLAAASGDYVLFLNAGDSLPGPGTLAAVADAIRHRRDGGRLPRLVYGDALERNASGRVLLKRARSHRFAWLGMFTHHQAILYRRSALAGRRYDVGLRIGADYALTLDVLEAGDARDVLRLPVPLCVCAPAGLSAQRPDEGRRDQFRIRRSRGMPLVAAGAIRGLQALAWMLKTTCPRPFERLRLRPAPPALGCDQPPGMHARGVDIARNISSFEN